MARKVRACKGMITFTIDTCEGCEARKVCKQYPIIKEVNTLSGGKLENGHGKKTD